MDNEKYNWDDGDLDFGDGDVVVEDIKPQVKPSPFRKRLSLFLAKDLSYLDETSGGALVPPPDQKDRPPESSQLERAEHSDLITLPDGIEGTNCGNCEYVRETYCVHPEVDQEVSPRMCCKYWDAPGTHRAWKDTGEKGIKGRWVTMPADGPGGSGSPVYIDGDGEIRKGPAGMVGKKPSELSSKKPKQKPKKPEKPKKPKKPASGEETPQPTKKPKQKPAGKTEAISAGKKWQESLSEDEREAVRDYSQNSTLVNKALRDCPKDLSCVREDKRRMVRGVLAELEAAVERAPRFKTPVQVHRGLAFFDQEQMDAFLSVAQKAKASGKPLRLPGYTSTSLDEGVADRYAHEGEFGAKLVILAKHGAYLDGVVEEDQQEILQQPLTKYRLVKIQEGKRPTIYLEEV